MNYNNRPRYAVKRSQRRFYIFPSLEVISQLMWVLIQLTFFLCLKIVWAKCAEFMYNISVATDTRTYIILYYISMPLFIETFFLNLTSMKYRLRYF